MSEIGHANSVREFFSSYRKWLKDRNITPKDLLILKLRGFPDSYHLPLPLIQNSKGKILDDLWLYYVVDSESGLPIYVALAQPNEDIAPQTINSKFTENLLKSLPTTPRRIVFDGTEITRNDLLALCNQHLDFIASCPRQSSAFQELQTTVVRSKMDAETFILKQALFKDRTFCACHAAVNFFGINLFVYLYIDQDKKNHTNRGDSSDNSKNITEVELNHNFFQSENAFILLSNQDNGAQSVLEDYLRMQQAFHIDVYRHNRLPGDSFLIDGSTLYGLLLLGFTANVFLNQVRSQLKTPFDSVCDLFGTMRTQKAKVYADRVIPTPPKSKHQTIYRMFNITSMKERAR